ncbi:hypothetical protein D3C76_1020250 [compost metagenome]
MPAGHQIHAETPAGDGVNGRCHTRHNRWGQGEGGGGGVDLNARRHRRQTRHQSERLQIVIPEFGFAAEAAQFDHRECKVEMVMLRLLHNGFVQLEGRHVLRRVGGD